MIIGIMPAVAAYHAVVVHIILQNKVLQSERNGVQVFVDQEHKRILIVIPVPGEINNGQCSQRWLRQGAESA